MRREIDRVFTVFFSVVEWKRGTCDPFVALSLHEGAFSFRMLLDKLAFFAKSEIRLELKLEY